MKGESERVQFAHHYPVAVFGGGVSGRAAARLARSLGAEVQVYDQRKGSVFGREEVERTGLVVTSPGFHRDHPWIVLARKAGCMIMGELDFASLFWFGRIIAVTGSNGKTTVTEFLTKVLRESNLDAVAAGNIGYPLSTAALEHDSIDAVAVCEVSSFQAESLELLRPASVLWTSFSEDHLDRHANLQEYFKAKARLTDLTASDSVFLGAGVSEAGRSLGVPFPKRTYHVSENQVSECVIPKDSPFNLGPQKGNYALVRAYCRSLGIEDEAVERAASGFHLPGHRLSQPWKVGDVSFWNDSKATNFGATVAACRHFAEKTFWIGGGQSKGGDLSCFCKRMKQLVRKAYLIGSNAQNMKNMFSKWGTPATVFATLNDAVKQAFHEAKGKTNVLFSPGFASFDQFRGFEDRGKCFEQAVLDLKNSFEPTTRPLIA